MNIGVPKEIKNNEFRVSTTPSGVHALVKAGHNVFVESGAGLGSAITDGEYQNAGATILDTAEQVWAKGDLIIKVKEPIEAEYPRMRKGQTLFTYLHLAASRPCTEAIIKSGITAIAFETVELNGTLPLLAPMSEVAGRMSIQVGATALQKPEGGRGVLLGGVPGVKPAKVVVLGGGVVGLSAATIALGMRADVTILDLDLNRLRQIDDLYQGQIKTLASSAYAIQEQCLEADLVIGAVLVHGAKAPRLVSDELVSRMKPGSVLVDVAIDQGGCFEGSKPTTHSDPTFKVHNSLYYCVANMPGAVPATSTAALANATIKYALALANKGWEQACADDDALARGLNVHEGKIMYSAVAHAHGL
ncbi:MAG: alanine dehydrogenase [Actinobacteria bacterium]|jgi:alanine dehydrogenase|nr:alanine dehydrogenase [Actinomycetota bacterium]